MEKFEQHISEQYLSVNDSDVIFIPSEISSGDAAVILMDKIHGIKFSYENSHIEVCFVLEHNQILVNIAFPKFVGSLKLSFLKIISEIISNAFSRRKAINWERFKKDFSDD